MCSDKERFGEGEHRREITSLLLEAAPAQIKWDGKEIEIMARRYT